METIRHRIIVKSTGDYFSVIPIGDIHSGIINCDEERLKADIDYIRTHKNVYWVGMGDYCEFVNSSDKRFDVRLLVPELRVELDNLAYKQSDRIIKMFKPIASKCLGMLEGNHEEYIKRAYHVNVQEYICNSLRVRNLSCQAFITLQFIYEKGRLTSSVVIWAEHGHVAGKKVGGNLNYLHDQASNFNADIYLCGHSHKKVCDSTVRLEIAFGGGIRAKKLSYGITGSYYRGHWEGTATYQQKNCYPPTNVGCLKIKIFPFKKKTVDDKVKEYWYTDVHISE